jgi:hypothetical protein
VSSPRTVQPEARLEALLACYLEKELPPNEDAELAGLLAERPRALEDALRLIRQNEELRDVLSPRASGERLGAAVAARLRASGHSRRFATGLVKAIRARSGQAAATGKRRTSAYVGWAAAAAVVLTLVGALAVLRGRSHQAPAAPWSAEVASVQGQVELQRNGTQLAARAGTKVLPGDRIATGAGGSLTLRYNGEATSLEIGGDARAALSAEGGSKRLSLEQGRLKAEVAAQPAGRPMVLATPRATAVVLGTRLALSAAQDADRLDVLDGLVRFERQDRPVSLEVSSGGHALARAGSTVASNARCSGPGEALRSIEDHEGPLAWQQLPDCAPLVFETTPLAHGGRSGLRVVYQPKAGDPWTYGEIGHPFALKPGDRAMRFFIKVERYEANADWNIQFRQRDRNCWLIGGGLLSDLGPGWNLVELEFPREPVNTYGGGAYRPAEVHELMFSVCQRAAALVIDDFSVVGGGSP